MEVLFFETVKPIRQDDTTQQIAKIGDSKRKKKKKTHTPGYKVHGPHGGCSWSEIPGVSQVEKGEHRRFYELKPEMIHKKKCYRKTEEKQQAVLLFSPYHTKRDFSHLT